jgi:hypothetical protein
MEIYINIEKITTQAQSHDDLCPAKILDFFTQEKIEARDMSRYEKRKEYEFEGS